MPLIEICGHVVGDRSFMRFQLLYEILAFPGRDLVADMQELAEVRIVSPAGLVMPESRRELLTTPGSLRYS